jgi:hypothetical protein
MLYGFLHRNRNLFGENEFARGLAFYSDGIAMFVLEEKPHPQYEPSVYVIVTERTQSGRDKLLNMDNYVGKFEDFILDIPKWEYAEFRTDIKLRRD